MINNTAVLLATGAGHVSTLGLLLEYEVIDVSAANNAENTAVMIASYQGLDSILDMLAEAGAILSFHHSVTSLHEMVSASGASPEKKVATLAVLKKHGIISSNAPLGFQSKYYFQDGEGKFYTKNVKYQRWINRRILLLALYRTYQWSLANQVEDDARRTLPPDSSKVGRFICQCWFDCAGGGNDVNNTADTIGNGIGRLIMQLYGGFDASKSPFALRGTPEYGKIPDNAARCSSCLAAKEEIKALRSCASCGKVRYCGTVCQKADWKRHKESCKIWAEEKKKKGAEKKKNC
jgi:hypothetical protein